MKELYFANISCHILDLAREDIQFALPIFKTKDKAVKFIQSFLNVSKKEAEAYITSIRIKQFIKISQKP